MKKAVWSGVIAATGLMLFAASANAQNTDIKSINVQVNVNARAKLTLGTNAITFTDADPDSTPTFTSSAVSVDVKARTADGNVTLTVIADGQFDNAAGNTIDLATLTWSATGTKQIAAELSARGYPAYVLELAADDPDGPYRVRIGHYRSRAAAAAAVTRLERARGEKLWVIRE